MIRRFLLLSVLTHAVVAAVIVARPHVQWAIPAPALSVELKSGAVSAAAPVIRHNRAALQPDARATPLSTQPGTVSTSITSASVATDLLRNERHDDNTRANHLLAILRAAIDQHFMYPPLAQRHGWEGKVRVGVRLNPDGLVDAFHVTRSSGHTLLDRDALLTLERISALPDARTWLNGRPYETEITIDYRLTEG